MWASLEIGYWLCLLLSVPAAGFLVRLFMIQHDCGHGSFFRRRLVNDWVGRVIGVVTLTPYDFWRRTHAIHHANSGNLDHRGIGDIGMLTVREYLVLSRWRQLLYRLYRHPLVMFGVGPAYHFVLRQRLPFGLMRSGWQPWLSTMATNIAIVILVTIMILLVGFGPFLLVHLPITFLGASIGVWLFYVQHQFEDTFWTHDSGWNFHELALRGARTMTCRMSCAGSPPISACTTSIIYAAEFHTTDCHACYEITRSSLQPGVLPYWKASSVYGWFSGTRPGSGESLFATCTP